MHETITPLPEHDMLDPHDWEAFRRLSHRMLDNAINFVRDAAAGPVWKPVPQSVKEALSEPLPLHPLDLDSVCNQFLESILPYATGNIHPRFFGWVHGNGTASGIIAEMMSAAMNSNVGGRDHGAVYVERQVIDWCRQLFGFSRASSGLLVSGTSMANLIGLTVARNHMCGYDVRHQGVRSDLAPPVAYTSTEAHESVAKSLEVLGIGSDNLRAVPVNDFYQIRTDMLDDLILKDRKASLHPFCVIGTAGTVNTAAIDDLDALSDICRRENLWFHVDGAFGALAIMSEQLKPRLRGIEKADSIAFDFHKWMHVQYDAGFILIRNGDLHKQAFSARKPYLASAVRGLAAGDPWFCEYGPELSRCFRALKVWFVIKEHGIKRLGDQVLQNCIQAKRLEALISANAKLQLLAPVSLNIVCFRYYSSKISDQVLNRLNAEIVMQLHEAGVAVPSTTILHGLLAIRVNLTNHRCMFSDLVRLVDQVVTLGDAALIDHGSE